MPNRNNFFMTLLIQSLTVTLIVPAITLIATLSTVLRDIEVPYSLYTGGR